MKMIFSKNFKEVSKMYIIYPKERFGAIKILFINGVLAIFFTAIFLYSLEIEWSQDINILSLDAILPIIGIYVSILIAYSVYFLSGAAKNMKNKHKNSDEIIPLIQIVLIITGSSIIVNCIRYILLFFISISNAYTYFPIVIINIFNYSFGTEFLMNMLFLSIITSVGLRNRIN